jgi:hypothetical protein
MRALTLTGTVRSDHTLIVLCRCQTTSRQASIRLSLYSKRKPFQHPRQIALRRIGPYTKLV